MLEIITAYIALMLMPVLIVWFFYKTNKTDISLILINAVFFTIHLCSSPLINRMQIAAPSNYILNSAITLILTCIIIYIISIKSFNLSGLKSDINDLQIIFVSVILVVPAIFLYNHQGYFAETNLSLFAPGFSGDQLRNANIIAALVENRQSIYFPETKLVYQIAWHNSAANIASSIRKPEFSWLPIALGAAVYTSVTFYSSILWLIKLYINRSLSIKLALCFGLIMFSDSDLVGSLWTYFDAGHFGIAADNSSTFKSPFRYFSVGLLTMTAPNHVSYFIPLIISMALYERNICFEKTIQINKKTILTLILIFISIAGFIDPILFFLCLVPFWLTTAFYQAKKPRIFTTICGFIIIILLNVYVMYHLLLGFSVIDLFLRPRITGGGTGEYGFYFLGGKQIYDTIKHFIFVIPETCGEVGIFFLYVFFIISTKKIKLYNSPIIIYLIVSFVLWNIFISETEIQRHFSMISTVIIGFYACLLCATYIKNNKYLSGSVYLASIVAFSLNINTIKHLSYGGAYLTADIPWRDYFCINDLIKSKYTGMPVVVRTPDNLELPISSEATTSMVWSQVSFVHQGVDEDRAKLFDKINTRDRKAFKNLVIANPSLARESLNVLGFQGLIWGPVEQNGWGSKVFSELSGDSNFIESCGKVGLFWLSKEPRMISAINQNNENMSKSFFEKLSRHSDPVCSSVNDVKMVSSSDNTDVPEVTYINYASNGDIKMSTNQSSAVFAVDGILPASKQPIPLAMGDGAVSNAYWEIDLKDEKFVEFINIFSRQDCCEDDLRDFYLLVSKKPFDKNLLSACRSLDTIAYYHDGVSKKVTSIPINRRIRYVKIQTINYHQLSLAEVQILSRKK